LFGPRDNRPQPACPVSGTKKLSRNGLDGLRQFERAHKRKKRSNKEITQILHPAVELTMSLFKPLKQTRQIDSDDSSDDDAPVVRSSRKQVQSKKRASPVSDDENESNDSYYDDDDEGQSVDESEQESEEVDESDEVRVFQCFSS
jgi:cobalamin biosynthesis protein CobT